MLSVPQLDTLTSMAPKYNSVLQLDTLTSMAPNYDSVPQLDTSTCMSPNYDLCSTAWHLNNYIISVFVKVSSCGTEIIVTCHTC
jgi:hypothetical protein